MPRKKTKFKTKREEDYYNAVLVHKKLVKKCIEIIIDRLKKRARTHDNSKLEEPEFSIQSKDYASLHGTTYGSDKYYEERLKNIEPALDCHYAKNRHHPEHFPDGIKDMNLIDLCEMLADWYSATQKHDDGNIQFSVEHNTKRFNISKDLECVFKNTIALFDAVEEGEETKK